MINDFPIFQIFAPLGVSAAFGLAANALWWKLTKRSDLDQPLQARVFPRTYLPSPIVLKRQCRLLFIILSLFLVVPVWQAISVLLDPKPHAWIATVIISVTLLPFFLLMGWMLIKVITSKVTLEPDRLAVATRFGQKEILREEIAGIRLEQAAFPAIEGTKLAWLGQKGAVKLVSSTSDKRSLLVPCGIETDATLDAWLGNLTALDNASETASTPTQGTSISEASAQLPGTKKKFVFPFMTTALLLVLVVVFIGESMFAIATDGGKFHPSTQSLLAFGSLNKTMVVQQGQWFRIVAAMFLHQNWFHLLMNGIVLLFMGMLLEKQLGGTWLLALFVVSGIGGSFMSLLLNPPTTASVGASGAIMGLMTAAFVLTSRRPRGNARFQMRSGILRLLIPALLPGASKMHVDIAAHLGGAITGAMLGILLLMTWRRDLPEPKFRRLAMGLVVVGFLTLSVGLGSGLATVYTMRADAAQSDAAALADLDRALKLDPKLVDAYNMRGVIRFTQGQYDLAADDFRASVDIAPDWIYNAILLHLSLARVGVDDRDELARNASRVDLQKWPGPMLGLLSGRAPFRGLAISNFGKNKNEICEASFYGGEFERLNGHAEYAMELVRQAADTCPSDFIEGKLAKAELARLGH